RGGHRPDLGGPGAPGARRPDGARTLRLRRQPAQGRGPQYRPDRGAGGGRARVTVRDGGRAPMTGGVARNTCRSKGLLPEKAWPWAGWFIGSVDDTWFGAIGPYHLPRAARAFEDF